MAGVSTGLLKKLKITACTVDKERNVKANESDSSDSFEVMLNPTKYKHSYTIFYDQDQTPGQIGSVNRFQGIQPEKVNFEITIDGTGVVNLPIPGVGSPPVKDQVKSLTAIVYRYVGNNHEPNHVRLLWGSLIFFGRLESMTVDYTLFKPSGEPLRARVEMTFRGFMSSEEKVLRANNSSPDLSHLIQFKAGDTLPMLCYRVYKDSSYYIEVARINKLSNFRDIKPGTKLHFPPLR